LGSALVTDFDGVLLTMQGHIGEVFGVCSVNVSPSVKCHLDKRGKPAAIPIYINERPCVQDQLNIASASASSTSVSGPPSHSTSSANSCIAARRRSSFASAANAECTAAVCVP
jgi:hypothetical protein